MSAEATYSACLSGRPAFIGLVLIVLALAVGCGDDPSFCESICDDLSVCLDGVDFDECVDACEEELDVAFEVGGNDCVDAREDYLACVPPELCSDSEEISQCRLDAIDGEIEACGEALGEF